MSIPTLPTFINLASTDKSKDCNDGVNYCLERYIRIMLHKIQDETDKTERDEYIKKLIENQNRLNSTHQLTGKMIEEIITNHPSTPTPLSSSAYITSSNITTYDFLESPFNRGKDEFNSITSRYFEPIRKNIEEVMLNKDFDKNFIIIQNYLDEKHSKKPDDFIDYQHPDFGGMNHFINYMNRYLKKSVP
jgi:hypothetical protein